MHMTTLEDAHATMPQGKDLGKPLLHDQAITWEPDTRMAKQAMV